jgi:protein involved in polysaccharide export with SLBB domain
MRSGIVSMHFFYVALLPAAVLGQNDYGIMDINAMKRLPALSRLNANDTDSSSSPLAATLYGGIPTELSLKNQLKKREGLPQLAEIDCAIDENNYVVGPNDELTVYLWGSIDREIVASVNNEGRLIIPSVGAIPLNNMKLVDAKKAVEKLILDKYKNVSMTISLTNIHRFKVYIIGGVAQPGMYIANGASRVADLVNLAGGFKKETESKLLVRLRGIEIANDRYPTRLADLAAFYHNGEMSGNPYLLDGDRVFVSPAKEIVGVFGEVAFPGYYDVVDGDTFGSLLRAAGGFTRECDTTNIIISRFGDDIDSLITFHLSLGQALSFPIVRDDRILVSGIPDYRIHRTVELRGQVEYPGLYPIQKDKTRLTEIIAMAGGLTEDAFLPGSTILRQQTSKLRDREFERLKSTPFESLTPLERSYLKTKQTEENGRVSIDFQELYRNNHEYYNIILKDSDIITIACKDLSVNVTGAVVSPGLISHKPGEGYSYYISQVGGYNTRARKSSVMIIKGGTNIWLRPHEAKTIEAGDKIWVPEREYHDWFRITRDMLAMTAAVATIIISFYSITDRMK